MLLGRPFVKIDKCYLNLQARNQDVLRVKEISLNKGTLINVSSVTHERISPQGTMLEPRQFRQDCNNESFCETNMAVVKTGTRELLEKLQKCQTIFFPLRELYRLEFIDNKSH